MENLTAKEEDIMLEQSREDYYNRKDHSYPDPEVEGYNDYCYTYEKEELIN